MTPNERLTKFTVDMITRIGKEFASDPSGGTAAEKIHTLLSAIAHKCATCMAVGARFHLEDAAACVDKSCPLHEIGPSLFLAVKIRLDCQDVVGGVQ